MTTRTNIDTGASQIGQLFNGVDFGACMLLEKGMRSTRSMERTDSGDNSSLRLRLENVSVGQMEAAATRTLRLCLFTSLATGAVSVLSCEFHSS